MAVTAQHRERIDLSMSGLSRPTQGTVSALVGPDSDVFRELADAERSLFPELEVLTGSGFAFWIVRDGPHVLHAMRLAFPTVIDGLLAPFLIHDVVRSGQITASEIEEEFASRGFHISQFVSVESSFRVAAMNKARSAALPGYLGLTSFVERTGRSGVLAHQNAPAEKSMARVGLYSENLSLRRDIHTPSLSQDADPDDRYWPILLPLEGQNEQVLKRLERFVPPHQETYIDLRPLAEETRPSQRSSDRQYAPNS